MPQAHDKAADTIISCMKEHDIDDVEVMQSYNHERLQEEITIVKRLGDKKLAYRFAAPNEEFTNVSAQKKLTLNAEQAAVQFNKKMRTTFSWKNSKADISMYDGGWAKCKHCGTEVELPPPKVDKLFTQDAELSTPHPMPKEPDNYVSDMKGHQEVLLKLYLIGRMKEQCDMMCQERYADEPKALSV